MTPETATAHRAAGAGDLARRRAFGAYYTPEDAAHYLASWVLAGGGSRVLEPSVGDGSFLDALAEVTRATGRDDVQVTAVELDPEVARRTAARPRDGLGVSPLTEDFLTVDPAPHDAVIGNPPYVRLRHLPDGQRSAALRAAERWLGVPMDPSGSIWMPFVLHAAQSLRPGGRMALVLPYEFTHVRYAHPLWEFLAARFGSLRVVRIFERIFPDILQDVLLLFAAEKGHATTDVSFEAYETFDRLRDDAPTTRGRLPVDDVIAGRPFVASLLPAELRALLAGRLAEVTRPAHDHVTFRIGYVAGDKTFFHPSDETLSEYGLAGENLRPALGSARLIRGGGLWTSELNPPATTSLFLPDPHRVNAGEERYLAHGVATGVNDRYKCRIRSPWYVVPAVHTPDVVVTVFSETPLLMANDGALAASNSFLCGFADGGADVLARQWYTSLTRLYLELQVHALGGGVFVLVPRETGNVRIVRPELVAGSDLAAVHRSLLAGDIPSAYRAGDAALVAAGGLTQETLDLVREGTAILARWRQSAP